MIGKELWRIFLCTIFFTSLTVAQAGVDNQQSEMVESCLKKYFPPVFTIASRSKEGFRKIRCTEPSPLLCDVSWGISHGNYEGIDCLVRARYDFNVENGKLPAEFVPIIQASYHDVRMLELLFGGEVQVKLEVRDRYDSTALIAINLATILSGDLINRPKFSIENAYQSTELLLRKGADPDASRKGVTSLMLQSGSGHARFIALLLQYGADPNVRSDEGETALMRSSDDPEKIKLLINGGSDIYLKDDRGNSAIFHAIRNCQPNKFKALVEKDNQILESVNSRGITAREFLRSSYKCMNLSQFIPNGK